MSIQDITNNQLQNRIEAYKSEIQRMDKSIEERRELLKEKKLNDEQIKQLTTDVGTRFLTQFYLDELLDEVQHRPRTQQQQQQQ
ncbi:unnamed protein product [Rotaria magnacalcarata]|uniref:Uncharacterized protein n=2 Tax=Rotaria magnacalcarata TaxID=392030 RepID=A0A8S2J282_9BILA|nr:unnamed protein product [Rotaria magnacalcarata]CAF3788621.1 unnamed protein product [Rotaria magnacalcarata]CAF3789161.1 unnamed protein product [Rotaria magnacalcarata]